MSYYYKAYTVVEDMIFENESRKTRELSFNIAKDILNNSKREGSSEGFKSEGDIKYSVLKYVECNIQEL